MRAHSNEMSLQSTFAWVVVAFAASAATLALISGFVATRTIAISSQPWPFAG